ncbi:MAG: FAD-binding oxidoreductase [Leptospiraceae bacterium]|nr:FAD-binding oxidoreductase [Leptospiraceae bacterium]MDW7976683.1 FAD-binding oxidoreductase [Leptospiraceae bacterium]
MKKIISNWGNYPTIEADIFEFQQIHHLIKSKQSFTLRGLGRSYGDSSLGERIVDTTKNRYFLHFDEEKGYLTCEAGISLAEILEVFVPKGWFLPVTPGTKFITIGGAISSDVHGKNHHKEGSFCKHVVSMEVLLASGKQIECSPTKNVELFQYICGGMGLLGAIKTATIKLKKIETAYIKQITYKAKNLEEMLTLFHQHEDSPYTVAWMDCLATGRNLGRGILFTGDHAKLEDLPLELRDKPLEIPKRRTLTIPFYFPSFVLNPLVVKIFNFLYYHTSFQLGKPQIVDYDHFFYPLDSLLEWNKIYGKRGFVQYQFVLPKENGLDGTKHIIEEIAKRKMGSFLVVFKVFGNPNKIPQEGSKKVIEFPFSFPKEGYTLALDFPLQPELEELLSKLDEIVIKYNGRLYLTKDARMKKEMFYSTYPVEDFLRVKKKYDPQNQFTSLQAQRLGLITN